MQDKEGWTQIQSAWEKVFSDVASLGGDITTAFREAYKQHDNGSGASDPAAKPESFERDSVNDKSTFERDNSDALSDFNATVDKTMKATKTTFNDISHKVTEEGRGKEMSGNFEKAMKVSLKQLGGALTDLADRMDTDASS